MSGKIVGIAQVLPRLVFAALLAFAVLLPPTTIPAGAYGTTAAGGDNGDRTLTFYHTHTQQTATFTFRRNGVYDQKVLAQMNLFLADWRTHQPTTMDPALFDLLWEIYQDVHGTQPINIVSSYRSPATNAKLRAVKNSGVAENSQHMKGKAMDIFIPGVNLSVLRAAAMRHQVGGVGYYPTSGSPFVHVDTGSVRAWPRMTQAQLEKLFPDGKTLHLPTNGKPLSSAGRAYAQAQWNECHAVPCATSPFVGGGYDAGVMTASLTTGEQPPIPATAPGDLRATQAMQALEATQPVERQVAVIPVSAPLPIARPDDPAAALVASADPYAAWEAAGAPVPAMKSPRIRLATRGPLGADTGETALAALEALDPPKPAFGRPLTGVQAVTAYVATEADPGAQLALKMIIERETTGSLPRLKLTAPAATVHTASLGGAGSYKSLFDSTFGALDQNEAPAPIATALEQMALSRQPNENILQRPVELMSPELDHVDETLVQPVAMTADFWAVMSATEGYLDKSTELGPMTGRMGVIPDDAAVPAYDHFEDVAPLLVATP